MDLCGNDLGPEGAKAIAPAIRDSRSLTAVNLLSNQFDTESAAMLLKIKDGRPQLVTLCGLTHQETELDLSRKGLRPGDAMLLAPEIAVSRSLASV